MKKLILIVLVLLVIGVAFGAWLFLGPATAFDENKRTLYIRTNAATKGAILDSLEKNNIIKNKSAFGWLATRLDYWQSIKPGKYDIKKGSSLLTMLRMLRNGQQTPVNFTINKIRTKEDLARMAGSKFEFDSTRMLAFLNNADSLKSFDANAETALWVVLPDTYTYFWNTTPKKVYQKLADESKKFWNEERRKKASERNLTPLEAYILASIVEEETNANEEKSTIASVYLNRLRKGMPLQADPTVKFALKDFGLKRIFEKHLSVESLYNTYSNRGLPPGPICTPSRTTLNAVLNAPQTDYLYFVASPQFNGTHLFAATYEEHLRNRRLYTDALKAAGIQ